MLQLTFRKCYRCPLPAQKFDYKTYNLVVPIVERIRAIIAGMSRKDVRRIIDSGMSQKEKDDADSLNAFAKQIYGKSYRELNKIQQEMVRIKVWGFSD